MKKRSKIWTPEKEAYLIKYFDCFTDRQLAHKMGLKQHTIRKKARKLNLRKRPLNRWPKEKITYLKTNFGKVPNKQLAKTMNMGLSTLCKKAYELGLQRKRIEYWTENEVKILVEGQKTMSDKQLTEILNQATNRKKKWKPCDIASKRRSLGYIKSRKPRKPKPQSEKPEQKTEPTPEYHQLYHYSREIGYKNVAEAIAVLGKNEFLRQYKAA